MKTLHQQKAVMGKVMVIILALLTVPVAHALAGPHGLGGEVGAPIDGGISLLVAAGVGYGVKKVRAARKQAAQKTVEETSANI